MTEVLLETIETFVSGLGPLGDPGVAELARRLPRRLAARSDDLRVLMQAQRRSGARAVPVLLTVIAHTLVIEPSRGDTETLPLSECTVSVDGVKLAGMRLTIVADGRTLVLTRAMPVDEAPRLVWAAGHASTDGVLPPPGAGGGIVSPYADHPPVARLGAAATLYRDRISFAPGPSRMLVPGISARVLELPSPGRALRSVSRLMQGAHGKARHVLVDGPGWSEIAPAPETAPELADGFAAAIKRWTPAA